MSIPTCIAPLENIDFCSTNMTSLDRDMCTPITKDGRGHLGHLRSVTLTFIKHQPRFDHSHLGLSLVSPSGGVT